MDLKDKLLIKTQEIIEKQFLGKDGIHGFGIGKKFIDGKPTDELSVQIFVLEKKPITQLTKEGLTVIPSLVLDKPTGMKVKTDVIEMDRFEALAFTKKFKSPFKKKVIPPPVKKEVGQERWRKMRPAKGGVSIGGLHVTAGTLGIVVKDNKTGLKMILSNNHVLSACNVNKKGDPIYQPAIYDGGYAEENIIGTLERDIQIEFGGTGFSRDNYYDTAGALPYKQEDVSIEILDIGICKGTYPANDTPSEAVGKKVHKSGRTSFYDQGKMLTCNATVQVGYGKDEKGNQRYGWFKYQILFSIEINGGDSGTVIALLEPDNRLVSLMYAGAKGSSGNPDTGVGCPFDGKNASLIRDFDISLLLEEPQPPVGEIKRVHLEVYDSVGNQVDSKDLAQSEGDWIARTTLIKGSYTLRAFAYDSEGNSGSGVITVDVEETQSDIIVTFISPKEGDILPSGEIPVKVKAQKIPTP